MQQVCINIYLNSRVSAGTHWTQEKAAEQMHISIRSLHDYENGIRIPPDDIVCAMARLYSDNWLGYRHLKLHSPIGQQFLPDVQPADLAIAVLRLQKEMGDLGMVKDNLVEIACDNRVDPTERMVWAGVEKEIRDVAGAALGLLFAGGVWL